MIKFKHGNDIHFADNWDAVVRWYNRDDYFRDLIAQGEELGMTCCIDDIYNTPGYVKHLKNNIQCAHDVKLGKQAAQAQRLWDEAHPKKRWFPAVIRRLIAFIFSIRLTTKELDE